METFYNLTQHCKICNLQFELRQLGLSQHIHCMAKPGQGQQGMSSAMTFKLMSESAALPPAELYCTYVDCKEHQPQHVHRAPLQAFPAGTSHRSGTGCQLLHARG